MGIRSLLAIAAVVVGVLAVDAAFEWANPADWVPDLVVGWAYIGCGLLATSRRPASATGRLMVAIGFAWFLGNFAVLEVAPVAWFAAQTRYLHRGLLVHLLLTFPRGRPSAKVDLVSVAGGYLASIAPLARLAATTMAVGAGVIALAARRYGRAIGPDRAARSIALAAAVPFGLTLTAGQLTRVIAPTSLTNDAVAFAYQVVLTAVAVGLLVGLVRAPSDRTAVVDLVVELTGSAKPDLRAALARALGDPTLDVAYASPGTSGFVDATGEPVQMPDAGTGRAVTPIVLDGRTIGALVHDAAVLEDDGLATSIAEAARLMAENARLQAEVRAQIVAVQESRHRLVRAAAEEQRLLRQRLRAGAGAHLQEVGRILEAARALVEADGDDQLPERLAEVERQLQRTSDDIDELARGLHPTSLAGEGLDAALRELADRSSVSASTAISADGLPPDVAAAVYYVCAEALANVTKHAGASRCAISVEQRPGWVAVEVADDGIGGADPAAGTGLLGLTDRVEALGGELRVISPPGGGTRLTAELPRGREPA